MPEFFLKLPQRSPAVLVLEDGSIFRGQSFGAAGESGGEVVFNTSMTGYQEILTDPSYSGQIVTMTYPLIGNYGINDEDTESSRIQVAGFIIKELSLITSNWRSKMPLEEWMKIQNVVGLLGIDTRALVRKLRNAGVMRGVLTTADCTESELREKVNQIPSMAGLDLVQSNTCEKFYGWGDRLHVYHQSPKFNKNEGEPLKVIAFDFGIKNNILRHLTERGCQVKVVPAQTTAEDVLAENPDGIFLSNGPGDPEPVTYAVNTVKQLLGKKPLFGICLGHQILGLALGGKTYKLKFGHRGANQPVKNLKTGKVDITSQNHGFAVDAKTLPGNVKETHINLNDNTTQGLECEELQCFSVQYHPEASPGPHDATHHFDRFLEMMIKNKGTSNTR